MSLRIGIVGAGYQGVRHAAAYRQTEGAELVAVCDVDEERARQTAGLHGFPHWFTDYRAMLAYVELDLLSICTMPASHRAIAVAALRRGVHVLCEKPLATNLNDGISMAVAAREARRFLTVGYNMRWMGSARYLRGLVANGRLGRPVYCRAWLHETQIPWWGKHYSRAESGGGVVTASAGHVLDLALWIAGYRRPVSVSACTGHVFPRKRGTTAPTDEARASYDVEDIATALIRFDDGFWIMLEAGWAWDALADSQSLELVGDRASATLEPLRIVGERDGCPVDLTPDGISDGDWDESVARGVRAVVSAVLDGRAPLVTMQEALTVQSITDAIYQSAERGAEATPSAHGLGEIPSHAVARGESPGEIPGT